MKTSEISIDNKGRIKANFLSLITAAPKIAIAIWGANPAALKIEPIIINNAKATKADLFCFIKHNFIAAKIK